MEQLNSKNLQPQNQRYLNPQSISRNKIMNCESNQQINQNLYLNSSVQPQKTSHGLTIGGQQNQNSQNSLQANGNIKTPFQQYDNQMRRANSCQNSFQQRINYQNNSISPDLNIKINTNQQISRDNQQQQSKSIDIPLRINEIQQTSFQKNIQGVQSYKNNALNQQKGKLINQNQIVQSNTINQQHGRNTYLIQNRVLNENITSSKDFQYHSEQIPIDTRILHQNQNSSHLKKQNQENNTPHRNQQIVYIVNKPQQAFDNILKSKENNIKNGEKEKHELNTQQSHGIRLLNKNILGQSNKNIKSSDNNTITQISTQEKYKGGDTILQLKQYQTNQSIQDSYQKTLNQKQYIIKTEGQDIQRVGVRLLSQESDNRLQVFQKYNQQQEFLINNLQNRPSLKLNTTPNQSQYIKLQRSTSFQLPENKHYFERQSSQQLRHNSSLQYNQLNNSQPLNNQLGIQTPINNSSKQHPVYFSQPPNPALPHQFNQNENSSESLSRQIVTPKSINTLQSNRSNSNPQTCPLQKLLSQQQFKPQNNLGQLSEQNKVNQGIANRNDIITQQQNQLSQTIPTQTQVISGLSHIQTNQIIQKQSPIHTQGNNAVNNNDTRDILIKKHNIAQECQSQLQKTSLDNQDQVRDSLAQDPKYLTKQVTIKQKQISEPYNCMRQNFYQKNFNQSYLQNELNIHTNSTQDQQNSINLKVRRSSLDNVCLGSPQSAQSVFSPTFTQTVQNRQQINQFQQQSTKNEKYGYEQQNFEQFTNQSVNNNQYETFNQINEGTYNINQVQTISPLNKKQQDNIYIDPSSNQMKQTNNLTSQSPAYRYESRQSTIKSPIQNSSVFKQGEFDSPINIISLPQNVVQQNTTSENKYILQKNVQEFNQVKPPSNEIYNANEEKQQNKHSPSYKQSFVQISINQYCDDMINIIAKEKESRSQENTPKNNNQNKDSRNQQRDNFSQQNNTPDAIQKKEPQQTIQKQQNTPIRISFSQMPQQYTVVPVHQQYSPSINQQNLLSINNSTVQPTQEKTSPHLVQIPYLQIKQTNHQSPREIFNLNQQEEKVKRTNNAYLNEQRNASCEKNSLITPRNNKNIILNHQLVFQNQQQSIPEFLIQQDQMENNQKNKHIQNNSPYKLLKQEYSSHRQQIEMNSKDDNDDFFNIGDPQFTFSNTKKNISFEQQQFEEEMQNLLKINQIKQDIAQKTPNSNNKEQYEKKYISQYQQAGAEFSEGFNLCERIIDTDGDKSCENRQNFEDCLENQLDTHNKSRSPRDEYYQRNKDIGQKHSLILSKYNKFDTPEKMFEKLNAQNQQHPYTDQFNQAITNQQHSAKKLSLSPKRFSPSKQNEQKMIISPQQCIKTNINIQKPQIIQPNIKQVNDQIKQDNQELNCFNNMIEISLEQNQFRQGSQYHFSPKGQFERQQVNQEFDSLKENTQISILQQNIQKNVEKFIPNLKEYEINKISQSIYNSVFEVMREKYNTETSSSTKFRDNQSLNQSTQNSMSTQKYFASNQKNQQIDKSCKQQQQSQSSDMISNNIDTQKEQLATKIMSKQQKEVNAPQTIKGIYQENKTQENYQQQRQQYNQIYKASDESEIQYMQKKYKIHDNEFRGYDICERECNTLFDNSNTDEEQSTFQNHRRQSEDFRKLLQAQEFQEVKQIYDAQQQSQIEEHKEWFDDDGTNFINLHTAEQKYLNQRSEEDYVYKNELSPIREIESTYDQIQQSNLIKNTHQDYYTNSSDEKCNQFERQKSNLKKREGYEEEQQQQKQQSKIVEEKKQFSRPFSNSLHAPNSLSYQQYNLINQQLINKINIKNLNPKELEMRNKVIECFEARKMRLNEEFQKKQEIPKSKQAYFEDNRQKIKIFLPQAQYEQMSKESQVLYSVPSNIQNKSKNNQVNSRRYSIQQHSKQQNSIEDWDQMSQNSRIMNQSNGFISSFSNIHSRKGSLNNLAIFSPSISLSSSSSIQCQLGQQINQKIQKEERQTNQAQNFAKEYVKKCMTNTRKQEPHLMKKIKSTLIANLKNGQNKQKDMKNHLRSQSNENHIIKDLLIQKKY